MGSWWGKWGCDWGVDVGELEGVVLGSSMVVRGVVIFVGGWLLFFGGVGLSRVVLRMWVVVGLGEFFCLGIVSLFVSCVGVWVFCVWFGVVGWRRSDVFGCVFVLVLV